MISPIGDGRYLASQIGKENLLWMAYLKTRHLYSIQTEQTFDVCGDFFRYNGWG